MSKITNDGLTRSGTGCFIAVLCPYDNSGRQMVNIARVTHRYHIQNCSETASLLLVAKENALPDDRCHATLKSEWLHREIVK